MILERSSNWMKCFHMIIIYMPKKGWYISHTVRVSFQCSWKALENCVCQQQVRILMGIVSYLSYARRFLSKGQWQTIKRNSTYHCYGPRYFSRSKLCYSIYIEIYHIPESLDEWSAMQSIAAESQPMGQMRRGGMHSRRQIVWYRSPAQHNTARPVSTRYRKRPKSATMFPPIYIWLIRHTRERSSKKEKQENNIKHILYIYVYSYWRIKKKEWKTSAKKKKK